MANHRIRHLRERRSWTQERLAAAARIAVRTVQRAEQGSMSAETRARIAGALHVDVESLAPEPPPTVQPVLVYRDSTAAVAWLVRTFGCEVRERVTDDDGQVTHGELAFGNGIVIVTRAHARSRWVSPRSLGGKAAGFLCVTVDDVTAHLRTAREAGAVIRGDLEEGYGRRRYRCLDLEGHEWCFVEATP